jgi:hypothetical protein
MLKCRAVCWFVMAAASIGATAQNSQVHSSSTKSSSGPLQTATKPLTPKSAMPSQHKSAIAVPKASTGARNTTAELTNLEQQQSKAGGPKSGSTGAAKSASARRSADSSARSGSGINFKYQKPVGGLTASTPDANAKSSGTPRVTKKN